MRNGRVWDLLYKTTPCAGKNLIASPLIGGRVRAKGGDEASADGYKSCSNDSLG